MIINLNGNELSFNSFNFGAGEVHIKFHELVYEKKLILKSIIRSSDDIMKILLAKNALDNMGCDNIELFIPYIPYSRQDRICDNGEAFSLKVFANLINSCNFKKVYVVDPHSDVSLALINNIKVIDTLNFLKVTMNRINSISGLDIDEEFCKSNIVLVSPDSGSNKKINKIVEKLYQNYYFENKVVKCDKNRDVRTGKLTNFEVFCDDLKGKTCLIIDDICSYGGTFQGIANALKEKNSGKIYLYVSHYEGVADINKLKESGIEHVFTTDSMGCEEFEGVYKFKIKL